MTESHSHNLMKDSIYISTNNMLTEGHRYKCVYIFALSKNILKEKTILMKHSQLPFKNINNIWLLFGCQTRKCDCVTLFTHLLTS